MSASYSISKTNATHFNWGNGCEGWWLLRSENLTVIEEKMPNGTSEKKHYHKMAQQFFYVLQGILTVELEESRNALSPGEGILVPAGQAHKVLNENQEQVRFLVIASSDHKDDRVELE